MSLQPIPLDRWTEKFTRGCAAWLNDQGVVEYVTGSGTLTGARPPLHLNGLTASPDVAASLTPYGVDEDPELSDVVQGLQVMTRGTAGDKFSALALDDAVFNVLHGARGLVWNEIPVVVVARRSGPTFLGQDGNRRWELVSNYWATTARPTPTRVD